MSFKVEKDFQKMFQGEFEVLDQDVELVAAVGAGSRSRGFRGPLWSEQESRIRHFHRELDRYIKGEK